MSTLKQSMLLAGQPLSNNDPNMVITLKGADAAKVEITTIGNDSITYSFKEGVPTDTLYDLSLSFVYKDLYSLDVPLSLVNLGTVKDWEIVDAPISTVCWARGEVLPFKVMKGEEDITSQLLDVKFTPSSLLKAGDTGSKSWTIESETAFGATTVKAMYSFRLPTDLPEVSRTYEGTFNIAAYDGQELFVTPVVPDFKVAVGPITPVKYKIKFRNYRDATGVVRYVQAISSTTPINYSSQELKVPEQELWVNFGAPSEFEGGGTLVFGTAGTNSVLGKNRVDIKTNMVAYAPGFIIKSRTPELLVGKQGDIIEQTFIAKYDGVTVDLSRVVWDLASTTYFELVSAKDDKVTWKIVRSNNTGADVSGNVWVYLVLDGSTASAMKASYIQSATIKSKQQVTVVPDQLKMNLFRQSLFDYPMTVSDGNGVEYPISDPKVKIKIQPASNTSGSFIEKYDEGFIGKVIYAGGSQTVGVLYEVTIDGVPGMANASAVIELTNQNAVVACDYITAGPLEPNQETTVINNKYQLSANDVTVDKVLLSTYVNNPSTGNAIIGLLTKPISANNVGFSRNAKTGWTGALAEMTEYVRLPGGNIVYKATGSQQVTQAEITAHITNDTFRYNDGVKTTIPITLTQERMGEPDWTFATSTDIRNIMFDGTVKAATVVNNGGTFNITVTGNGTKGAGSVTFSIVENGVHYPKKIDLVAIDGLNVFVRDGYTTIYGGSNTDLTVLATAQWGGTNLGDVLEVTSDNPTVTVKSVSTVGGTCTTILTTPEGTELNGQVVNLTYTIKAGKPNAGNFIIAPVTFFVTSQKFMVYNGSGTVEGRRFSINPMLKTGNGTAQKLVFLKDGVKMDPTDPDIDYSLSTRDVAELPEIVGVDTEGKLFIKIRQDVDGFKAFYIKYRLISDPSYTYGALDQADVRLDINKTAGANMNSNINFGPRQTREGTTEAVVNDKFLNGLDNSPMTGKLIWQRNYNNPVTGNPFFNKDTVKAVQVGNTADFSFDLKTGWTGDYATIKMLHLSDVDGLYRNGSISVQVNKTPIVVTNNDNALLGPNLVTPVTLQIHQNRWGDPSENLANTQILNPTVENNLFTVADLVNNNDGTITFNATATAAGSALFSFTVKDGEFEYPASIQLTVGMYPLDLGEGFVKDIEGNSTATVTVVQSVKLP